MSDILLLEPGYSNKYPPIGLMKISYFHKYIHHDYVRFAKGHLPASYKDKKWDRVYVTTLFTFEWEKTKEAIEYALSVVKPDGKVYTGGILATLMPELIEEHFPTVINNPGLLDKPGTLGLPHDECIDGLTLDYGILDDIADQYIYPAHDAYFMYMTRGCGMKCEFCAVQTLEPSYYPYLSITDSVKKVDEQFGPKKDLLLMDNNVLRSPKFDAIVDEIKALGFEKGATYSNPKTGKRVHRYVDFNQGLDAFLLTSHKAKRLGELAIRPARIAFDHIEDEQQYIKAIRLCAENGITHMSNYLLYNGDDFSGKGHYYHADTPEDLYERMRLSMELQEELTEELGHKVAIFSFPMRYIPLSDLKRGYIGKNWNPKYLRAVQRMLIPTQGKGVSSRSFFEADFGQDANEFVENLAMPESHLGWRGAFIPHKGESSVERKARRKLWEENNEFLTEWHRLFDSLGPSKQDFLTVIKDNDFSIEKYLSVKNPIYKKLLIHYFTKATMTRFFSIDNTGEIKFLKDYICKEFPLFYKRLVHYWAYTKVSDKYMYAVFKVFGNSLIKDLLSSIDYVEEKAPPILEFLIKTQRKAGASDYNFELVKCFYLYREYQVLQDNEQKSLVSAIQKLDEKETRKLLLRNFDAFKNAISKQVVGNEIGADYIWQQINPQLDLLYQQLSMF